MILGLDDPSPFCTPPQRKDFFKTMNRKYPLPYFSIFIQLKMSKTLGRLAPPNQHNSVLVWLIRGVYPSNYWLGLPSTRLALWPNQMCMLKYTAGKKLWRTHNHNGLITDLFENVCDSPRIKCCIHVYNISTIPQRRTILSSPGLFNFSSSLCGMFLLKCPTNN